MENENTKKMIRAELTDGTVSYFVYDTPEQAELVSSGKKAFQYKGHISKRLTKTIGNSHILFQDDLIKLKTREDADCIVIDDFSALYPLADECFEFETAIYFKKV